MNKDILVLMEHQQGQVSDISYVMLAAGQILANWSGGDLIAMLMGHNVKELASDLRADKVLYVNHPDLAEFTPDAYLQVMSGYLNDNPMRVVMMGHTTVGMDIASGLSARLDLPLVNQVKKVDEPGILTSQICGGKIMVESVIPDSMVLVTMVPGDYKLDEGRSQQVPAVVDLPAPALDGLRIRVKEFIVPEVGDVDIAREELLIAVGRGLQNENDLELVEDLAEALHGAVCATRPLVDQGWLPTNRLVGKSGKRVAPKLYLALGISGAPEHVEGMVESEMVIAINTDPNAPIFGVADFGVETDLIDLLTALTDHVEKITV